jgi:hypothetical protein
MQRASIASRGSRPGGGAAFLSAIAADRTTVVLAVNHRALGVPKPLEDAHLPSTASVLRSVDGKS